MSLQSELQDIGLSSHEAQIYLALLRHGSLSASGVIPATSIPRSTVYPTLNSLLDRGLVEAEAGYGGRFSAVPPDQALPLLVLRESEELSQHQQQLLQRKRLAGELIKRLESVPKSANHGEAELVQVIRNLRAVAQRYDRLRLQARQSVEVFVKAPIFSRPGP